VFKSVFPISDFSGTSMLEFVRYEFEPPKYDVDECRQRGMTYAAPLKVTLRLIVFDIDEETGAKSVKDIKEQDVYMGDMPLMTMNGTFIVNGTERVIVSQMHRSPGVFFDHDKGKTHSSGKLLFAARIIPYRGSWLDIEFDAKDIVYARIDRRRKIPVTSLLFALGMDGEEILNTFYKRSSTSAPRTAGACRSMPTAGAATADQRLIDADTGKVVLEAGKKLTVRAARQLAGEGAQGAAHVRRGAGRQLLAEDLQRKTGEIYAEAGEEITEKNLKARRAGLQGDRRCSTSTTSMSAPTSATRCGRQEHDARDALFDIYRVMRPGEPPTLETARGDVPVAVLRSRALRPLRGRPRQDEHAPRLDAPDTMRTLRKEDILAVVKTLVDLRDGKGEIDDIDHLGNRRVRSVGELMENQYRIGLLRMERAIKERMSRSISTRDAARPDQRQAGGGAVREFFGSSQLSQFMDQTNPLSEITHKRRSRRSGRAV
jgi:DNA-directed RNA polymerase subunit beta